MSKINPLQKIAGIPDERINGNKKLERKDSADKPFKLDRVEISPQARFVQSAEGLQKSISAELVEEARQVGAQWYLFGYQLSDSDGMK